MAEIPEIVIEGVNVMESVNVETTKIKEGDLKAFLEDCKYGRTEKLKEALLQNRFEDSLNTYSYKDSDGNSLLHFAYRFSYEILQSFPVPSKEDVNCTNGKGETPLHRAAFEEKSESVKYLLEKGARVDVKDSSRSTPLHLAAENFNRKVVQSLIEAGASLQEPNVSDERPVGLIADDKLPDLLNILSDMQKEASQAQGTTGFRGFDGEAENTVLHYAAAYGKREQIDSIVRLVQSMKLDLDIRNSKGETAAHWAAAMGNAEFLESHSLFDLWTEDDAAGYNPLAHALRKKHMVFAKKLIGLSTLGEKFDLSLFSRWWILKLLDGKSRWLNRMPSFGEEERLLNQMPLLWTVLHLENEATNHFPYDAKFIHQHGALNEKDKAFGRTTLHWAAILGETEIITTLCRTEMYKQDLLPNLEDSHGKTALAYAIEQRNTEIQNQLRELNSVHNFVEGLYKDRQVYIDSANAILVGAALIASVTFAGWLQPPDNGYEKHVAVRIFWVFNSLSFFFAVATVVAGARAVLPMPDIFIGTAVPIIRGRLFCTAFLLALSIIFVLGAFAAAGFATRPYKHQANIATTVAVGGLLCASILFWFFLRLWLGHCATVDKGKGSPRLQTDTRKGF